MICDTLEKKYSSALLFRKSEALEYFDLKYVLRKAQTFGGTISKK